ncbi:hypothetical protein [Streptomyces coeruleorubidus]|jgi:hypothetical protein|uniref:hypothetical protein n=1 Tax=Streptomyces coeruleorubidus TaxID=116188 RepID=UPI0033A1B742
MGVLLCYPKVNPPTEVVHQALAARDELLAFLLSFADVHRTATTADDMEQRRLQMEQTAAERTEPQPQASDASSSGV